LVSNIDGGNRLRVFENRVLKKIFGTKTVEVTAGWRRLHNEEINYVQSYRHFIQVINRKV